MDRLRACNLWWLQWLIKEEWINLEHDINNMTLTALLKPVLLSINSLSHALYLSHSGSPQLAPVIRRPIGSTGKLTRAHSLVIVIPRVSDSEQGVGGGGC